jgi:lysophospholipase L1-like esterase
VLVKSKNIASETQIVAECFEQIIQRIDTENITTATNARTQLQITLTGRLALASPTAVTDWTPFLTELSRQLEKELGETINDLNEVKKTLQRVSDTMKSLELPSHHIISLTRRIVQNNLDLSPRMKKT